MNVIYQHVYVESIYTYINTYIWSLFLSKANHSISQWSIYALASNAEEAEVEWFYEDLQDLL